MKVRNMFLCVIALVLISSMVSAYINHSSMEVVMVGKTLDDSSIIQLNGNNYDNIAVPIEFLTSNFELNGVLDKEKQEIIFESGIDNEKIIIPVEEAMIKDNKVYVSIAVIAEELGYDITWVQATRTLFIDWKTEGKCGDELNKTLMKKYENILKCL